MEKDKDKIFKDAAESFIKGQSSEIIQISSKITVKEQEELAKTIVEAGDETWTKLTEAIKGKYAIRFMNELEALNGRDYIRNYIKVLEYFVPKVNRQDENDKEKRDNTLIIVVNRQEKTKDEIIDITNKNN